MGNRTIFSVYNDLTDHKEFGSEALGVEIRQTVWAYDRKDILQDVIFVKWQLVNKSDSDWSAVYFAIWADPDVGDASDDLLGCDTLLNLGFCYNASNYDQNYGEDPPAVGFMILEGVTTTDAGENSGDHDMGMTSFSYYIGSDNIHGNPQTASDAYRYLTGRWRDGTNMTNDGEHGANEDAPPTRYMFPGDPETHTGWLDSHPDDRRMLIGTGPFDLPRWEDANGNARPDLGEPGVQEIIAAVLVARGSNNLNSVTHLKKMAQKLELLYDADFQVARPPAIPQVTMTEYANECVLSWDAGPEQNADGTPYESPDVFARYYLGDTLRTVVGGDTLEEYIIDDAVYNFYGYAVYQYADEDGSDPLEIARWHLSDPGEAQEYTGPRHIRITKNHRPDFKDEGFPLVNGKEYYFGVVAESYLRYSDPEILQSKPAILRVIPRAEPGVVYGSTYGDTIAVRYEPINPDLVANDVELIVIVADPSHTTGHEYRVFFLESSTGPTWDLIDETDDCTVLAAQTNIRGDEAYTVVDGLLVKVASLSPGIKAMVELDPASGEVYDSRLWSSLNNYGRSQHWPVFVISEDTGTDLARIDQYGRMTPKDYDLIFSDADSTLVWEYPTFRVLKSPLSGKADFVPFVVWRIDPDGTRIRLPVCILDTNGDGRWSRSLEGQYGPAFELLYIYDDVEYKPAQAAAYIAADNGKLSPGFSASDGTNPAINHFMINMYTDIDHYAQPGDLDSNGFFLGPPHAGEWIRIVTAKPPTENDVFCFTAPAGRTVDASRLAADLDKIRVVPNPYYVAHNQEKGDEQWVQFTYLPGKCTLRIFDLAGNLIRRYEKDDPSTPFLRWDLMTEWGFRAASGVYVYHVEVPQVGVKTGKLVIFQAK